jgi:hypothetical protein
MEIKTIIQPHPGSFHNTRKSYTFKSFKRVNRNNVVGYPPEYAVISFSDGRVDRVEYKSRAEYDAHLQKVKLKLQLQHQKSGIQRKGCDCGYC